MGNEKSFALVTGASSGIGLAMSRELARRGYSLLIVSNEEEKLAKAAEEIEKEYGTKAIPLFMDLAQKDSAKKIFDYCIENEIKVKILINNAGIFFFRDITNTMPERMETVINLHVLTPSLLCRFFAEQMMQEPSPTENETENQSCYIINIASIAARMMMPGIALYSSTKSYLRCFSRAMHNETYNRGVYITTVCPGAVATGLYGLAPRYLKLGIRLGIIITPERLAYKSIQKMFKKKAEYIPGGLLNRFFIFIIEALPEWLVRRIKRKIDKSLMVRK